MPRSAVVLACLLLAAVPAAARAHVLHGATGSWSVLESPASALERPVEGFGGYPIRPARPVPARAVRRLAAAPPGAFALVGHSSLLARGMNAGLAVHGPYAYVGSRTDGSHANAGVLVVDVNDPTRLAVAGQIGSPNQANPGESSRELRVWPEQNLLIVLNFTCSATQHRCSGATVRSSIRFYDIAGANAAAPKLVATHLPSLTPHEMFLWDDPLRPGRALLYLSTYSNNPGMLILDISRARARAFTEWRRLAMSVPTAFSGSFSGVHSLSLSADGRRAYLADLGGGFLIADTSQVAAAAANPAVTLITPVANRGRPQRSPGTHTAVPVPGRSYALATEETYGPCPWAWVYTFDIASVTSPRYLAAYRTLPFNDPAYCPKPATPVKTAHNPTLTRNVALISWHARGLQAVSLQNPAQPTQLAEFIPTPLASVATPDDLTGSAPVSERIAFWTYPIIRGGLVYVVDVRNGLYVLRYSGPLEAEISSRTFLEGNSNLGDAPALAG